MSGKDLKKELVAMSAAQQAEITAFLLHLRHANDVDYQAAVERRLNDKDPSHWLAPDEFERRLDQN